MLRLMRGYVGIGALAVLGLVLVASTVLFVLTLSDVLSGSGDVSAGQAIATALVVLLSASVGAACVVGIRRLLSMR